MHRDKKIIFRNGFGFSNTFWKNISPFFQEYRCIFVEENYFIHENKTHLNYGDNIADVGIGHSLGFWKLCQTLPKAKYLIGINAFTNFLGKDRTLRSSRSREYETFKTKFHRHPAKTLNNFYNRCGIKHNNADFSNINIPTIEYDLNLLANPIELTSESKVIVINAIDDLIVPKSITDDNFSDTRAKIYYLEKGKHTLGFHHVKSVSKIILDFIS